MQNICAFSPAYPLLEISQSAQAPHIGVEVLDDLSGVSSSATLEEVSAE